MRSTHPPIGSSSSRQHHQNAFDTTLQATPIAPLECFIATESTLDRVQECHEQSGSNLRHHSRKQPEPSTARESGRAAGLRQPRPHALSASQSTQDKSSPSPISFCPYTFSPDSINSIPSSPGDLSSITMSEDPHSLSASFPELPRSHSPGLLDPCTSEKGPVPQLVMPGLTVPQRRPFSETGRSLGKLKILVTGQAGIGKKSLILAIAQSSTHIVHMDSMDVTRKSTVRSTYASTRPKPWWRTDTSRNTSRRRRSSIPDEVLDRNICFVDCKAHSDGNVTSFPAVEYVESQLAPLFRGSIDDPNLSALLSGGTEPNVDLALYLLPPTGPSSLDIECIRSLRLRTNVIPLLARADMIPANELLSAKHKISRDLKLANIDCFSFSQPESASEYPHVYAVSSVNQLDHDTIDASILMASDYLPPLVWTELNSLVAEIVSVDGSAWLRHSAASKAIKWLRQQRCQSSISRSALICRQPYSYNSLASTQMTNTSTNRQYWVRVEVSSWAETLRQSLSVQRFNIIHQPSSVHIIDDQMSLLRTEYRRPRLRSRPRPTGALLSSHQDPLGLLELHGSFDRSSCSSGTLESLRAGLQDASETMTWKNAWFGTARGGIKAL
ncbi:hypothetical protein C2857_001657 [Epichloe festucae Fl1]|uniref:Septin-type G domain-containing protein n=1 Tax=Epichloe festucae (strain Fl1) TaxID=877507 RepID=A0A7U3SN86_EPIFF|nr:hypothetical protein C2857_001657 [Epichloe festucae Fl1]